MRLTVKIDLVIHLSRIDLYCSIIHIQYAYMYFTGFDLSVTIFNQMKVAEKGNQSHFQMHFLTGRAHNVLICWVVMQIAVYIFKKV